MIWKHRIFVQGLQQPKETVKPLKEVISSQKNRYDWEFTINYEIHIVHEHPAFNKIVHLSLPVSLEQINSRFIEYIDSNVTDVRSIL